MQIAAPQQRLAAQCRQGARAQAGKPGRPSPAAQHAKDARRPLTVAKAAATEVDSSSANGSTSTSANPLDFDELTDVIRMVHETDIVELELKSKRFSLAVRKKEALEPEPVYVQQPAMAAPPQFTSSAPVALPPPPPPAAPAAGPAAAPAPAAAAPAPASKPEGLEVTSPMSGTFYRSPAPGEPAFVKEGDRVTKGQTIGIIEAMKLMNEIEAEVSGEVVAFSVNDKAMVSPGQTLLILKP